MKTDTDSGDSELREAFDLLDFNHKGTIDISEIVQILKDNEYDKEYPSIFNFIKSIGEGVFSFSQFEQQFLKEQSSDAGLKQTFELFLDNPKENVITLETFKKICKEMGESFNTEEMEYIIKEIGDGNSINYEQFVKFMKKNINV